MGIRKCALRCRHVAHFPDSFVAIVDTAPRTLRPYPSLYQFLGDGSPALPLFELDGAQPSTDVRIKTRQCSFDLSRTLSEETDPSGQILVHAGDARIELGPPITWSELSASGASALFRAFRQPNRDLSTLRLTPQTEAEKVSFFGTGDSAFLGVHLQAQSPFDKLRDALHNPFP